MIDPLRSTFGLRFHPFRPDVPVTALTISAQVEAFLFRVEQQVRDGGFACITGQPGTGKSAALRLLAERIDGIKDATVGVLTRPHSNNADFYRELGHLFGVSSRRTKPLGRLKVLRRPGSPTSTRRARARACSSAGPGDEGQRPRRAALALFDEPRRACAPDRRPRWRRPTDRQAADPRRAPIRAASAPVYLDYASNEQIQGALQRLLEHAGKPTSYPTASSSAIAHYAQGNMRAAMTMADNLLAHALQHDLPGVDEQVFFEVFRVPDDRTARPTKTKTRRVSA
ncbi:MAG: ATP-binding protein [Sandaracinaceae bacterium]|nr:ATP-binding protein [Sandaracinaceae bacterium]